MFTANCYQQQLMSGAQLLRISEVGGGGEKLGLWLVGLGVKDFWGVLGLRLRA